MPKKNTKPMPERGEKMPSMVGFRPTPEVYKILKDSEAKTGQDRAEFIEECIREAAARVTERKLREQYEKAKAALEALRVQE